MQTRRVGAVVLTAIIAAVAGGLPAGASAGEKAVGLLAVQTARSGELTPAATPGSYSLVLHGVRPRVTTFEDGPGRRAGTIAPRRLLELLFATAAGGSHNAAISAHGRTMSIRLRAGRYDRAAATMTYDVVRLEGSVTLPSSLRRPSLFIDDIGGTTDLGGGLECAGWLVNDTAYELSLMNQWVYMWGPSEFDNNPGATVPPGGYTNWYDIGGGACQAAVAYGSAMTNLTMSVLRVGGPTQYFCTLSGPATDPPTTCTYDDAATQASGMITYVLSGGPP
jgi:hypothetical protein